MKRLIRNMALLERLVTVALLALAPFYRAALVMAMAFSLMWLVIVAKAAWDEWRAESEEDGDWS